MTSRAADTDPGGSPLPEVLADALRYRCTEGEREAGRRPPYPLADALRPHRDRIVRELGSRVLSDGDAPWVVTRMLAPQRRLDARFLDRLEQGPFEFGDAGCALVACAALSVDEARALISSVPGFDGDRLRRQIVVTLRDGGLLDEARAEADRIGEYSWVAHRDVAWRLAVEGDHEAFFGRWRTYAAGKGRDDIAALKATLVRGVVDEHGWRAAVDLALAEKRLGAGFTLTALSRAGEGMTPEQLAAFLAHDARGLLTEQEELQLLVDALVRAAPRNPTSEHPLLAPAIDRIIALDPLVDKATMRARDLLLFRLWPATAEVETLQRVKRALRTPSFKRELTVLPRDVVAASGSERGEEQR